MSAHLVVLLHGEETSAAGLQYTSARLQGAGHVVLAPEAHGFRGTRAPHGHRFSEALSELQRRIREACEADPLPVAILGHAQGATLALGYAVAHPDELDALILTAPLAQPQASGLRRAFQRFSDTVLPDAAARPELGNPDPVIDIDYLLNPIMRIGDIPLSTAQTRARREAALLPDLDTLTLATLLLWGTREGLHPPGGAEHLLGALEHTDLTRQTFDSLYHDLLTGTQRDAVLDVIVSWLDARS